MAKNRGFSKDPRIRAKQQTAVNAYLEQAADIGGDPERDREAKIMAVERAGYTRATRDKAKVAKFMAIWKSDETRKYVFDWYALSVPDDPDPVSVALRTIHLHTVQDDDSWGPRDRAVSLAAARELVRIFVPPHMSKVATLNLSAKVERPAEFDLEPVMQSRTILPAGQEIAKPTGPTGADDDDEELEDDDDSD